MLWDATVYKRNPGVEVAQQAPSFALLANARSTFTYVMELVRPRRLPSVYRRASALLRTAMVPYSGGAPATAPCVRRAASLVVHGDRAA